MNKKNKGNHPLGRRAVYGPLIKKSHSYCSCFNNNNKDSKLPLLTGEGPVQGEELQNEHFLKALSDLLAQIVGPFHCIPRRMYLDLLSNLSPNSSGSASEIPHGFSNFPSLPPARSCYGTAASQHSHSLFVVKFSLGFPWAVSCPVNRDINRSLQIPEPELSLQLQPSPGTDISPHCRVCYPNSAQSSLRGFPFG